VRLRNIYDRRLSGNLRVELPASWPAREPIAFSLQPAEDGVFRIALSVPKEIEVKDYPVKIAVAFDGERRLPRIEKPVVLSVISPEMLGNLMPNGDFETPDATGKGPEGWKVNGTTKQWAPAEGLAQGLGKHVLRFESSPEWEYCSRMIPVRGGQTYLYTIWVRNEDMGVGSNMTQYLADGQVIRLYDTQVLRCGDNNPHWQVFTCRKAMPAATQRVSFTPVVKGDGWATVDNIRVTIFEGTDYAAEAHRVKVPPRIDGSLGEWVTKCPIPLIGRNQVSAKRDDYVWTPDNLSGVGYLMWDEASLYVALSVRDDVHHATGSAAAEEILRGDSLVLGIDPTKRGPGAEQKSFAYYLSSAAPGGGSGVHALFRPREHSGGRPSGHLFKDSSIYDMAVVKGEGGCTYELRIPLSEVGIESGLGTKIGLSIQLNDNDGKGPAAQMSWGEGLLPAWLPSRFGIVTFVE
jgi:hypothetical protein